MRLTLVLTILATTVAIVMPTVTPKNQQEQQAKALATRSMQVCSKIVDKEIEGQTKLRHKRGVGDVFHAIGDLLGSSRREQMAQIQREAENQRMLVGQLQVEIKELYDQNGKLIIETKQQAAQLLYLKEKMEENERDAKSKLMTLEDQAKAVEKVFDDYKKMSEEEQANLYRRIDELGGTIKDINDQMQQNLEELDSKLTHQLTVLANFRKSVEDNIIAIEEASRKTTANLQDMRSQLTTVESSILHIGEVHAMQILELAKVAVNLDSTDQQADVLLYKLADINEYTTRQLNGTANALRSKMKSVFAGLQERVRQITRAQDMNDLIIKYSGIIDRLQYLIDFRDSKLSYNRDTQTWNPPRLALQWAQLVLNPNITQLKIGYILRGIDQLATGTTEDGDIIGESKSIYNVYKAGVKQFLEDYRKRAAFSQKKRNELVHNSANIQSEAFFIQMLSEEIRELQDKALMIRGEARIILLKNAMDETLKKYKVPALRTFSRQSDFVERPAHSSATSTVATGSESMTTQVPEIDDIDMDPIVTQELQREVNEITRDIDSDDTDYDSVFETRERRAVSAKTDVRTSIIKLFTDKNRQYSIASCTAHFSRLAKQKTFFEKNVRLNANFRKEPFFFMYYENGTNSSSTQIGFSHRIKVPVEKRSIRSLNATVPADCPKGLKSINKKTPLRCAYSLVGCRLCLACNPIPQQDKVTVQCAFRLPQITHFVGTNGKKWSDKETRRVFPRNETEAIENNATSANTVNPSEKWRDIQIGNAKSDDDDTAWPSELATGENNFIYAVTGLLSVDDPSNQTICGVLVGQPFLFDYDLVAINVTAISIDVCEKGTGRFVKTKWIPKSDSKEFQNNYRIVRVSHIFKDWIIPIPSTWVSGIGFAVTGFNGDTLTMELNTSLF